MYSDGERQLDYRCSQVDTQQQISPTLSIIINIQLLFQKQSVEKESSAQLL